MTAFDESQRPISTVDFVSPPEPNEKTPAVTASSGRPQKSWNGVPLSNVSKKKSITRRSGNAGRRPLEETFYARRFENEKRAQ